MPRTLPAGLTCGVHNLGGSNRWLQGLLLAPWTHHQAASTAPFHKHLQLPTLGLLLLLLPLRLVLLLTVGLQWKLWLLSALM
jgi:hypothetical protein